MQSFKKPTIIASLAGAMVLSFSSTALAHVSVKPAQVATGAFQTFTVGVPVEKDIPTTGVKLEVPGGLKYVTPTAKPGWKISVDKQGSGEDATVKSITWSDGQIDPGLRDEFTFSAQAPARTTDLNWKAYQTYQDGSTVAWDKAPSEDDGHSESDSGPYSITKVASDNVASAAASTTSNTATTALYVAIAGLVVSLAALFMALSKKAVSKK